MEVDGTWGGEPELAAAPYVLRHPVEVYQAQPSSAAFMQLKLLSTYGQEYDDSSIRVLFSGAHYDVLTEAVSAAAGPRSRL